MTNFSADEPEAPSAEAARGRSRSANTGPSPRASTRSSCARTSREIRASPRAGRVVLVPVLVLVFLERNDPSRVSPIDAGVRGSSPSASRARRTTRVRAPGLWLAPASNAPLISPAHAAAALAAHLADETRAGTGTGDGTGAGAVLSSSRREVASRSVDRAADDSDAALLVDCPHAIPFDHRVRVFRQLVRDDRARAGYAAQSGSVDADEDLGQRARPVAEIVARRGRVLRTRWRRFYRWLGGARATGGAVRQRRGVRRGGHRRWRAVQGALADACGAGFDPRAASSPPPPITRVSGCARRRFRRGRAILELVGALVGKGLDEGILQETRFALHFAKYLLGAPRTLDDLACSIPSFVGRSRSSFATTATSRICAWTDRARRTFRRGGDARTRPGGGSRRHERRSIGVRPRRRIYPTGEDAQDAAFARIGASFGPWARLFSAPELSQLMSGAEDADVDIQDLREHARYSGGYTETSRAVVAFWEVVKGFTPEERRALLKFVTSSSRPPVQGFRHLHPPFTIHKVRCEAPSVFSAFAGPDVDRLPSASTCFNVLKLPNYRRRAPYGRRLGTPCSRERVEPREEGNARDARGGGVGGEGVLLGRVERTRMKRIASIGSARV